MFRKGHRLFSVASIGLLLVAVMQAVGYFAAPSDELLNSGLLAAMQNYRVELLLGSPSMMDIHDGRGLILAISLLWIGVLNLFIARYTPLREKLMRRVGTLNVFVVASLVVVFSIYQMLVSAITLGIVEVLFVIARYRFRRSRIVRPPTTGMGSNSATPPPAG